MSFASFAEIISFAAEKEREAVDFYMDLAEKASHSGAKELLLGFSKEERKHQDMLENIGKNKSRVDEYQFNWIPDIKRSDYLVEIEYEKGMAYPDLLRIAMKREESSLKLYNQLMAETKDHPELVKVFKMLCQEEASHKLKLETLYDDYMAKQGD